MRLWEVADIVSGRRISLHWTRFGAELAAHSDENLFHQARLRTLPKWTRPFHRLIVW